MSVLNRITTIYIKKIITFLSSVVAFFFTTVFLYVLGGESSNDKDSYISLWHRLQDVDFFESVWQERYEVGFLYLYWSLSHIFSSSVTFYVVGLIALSIKYYLFKKHLNYSLFAWFIYISIFLHILDANQIRVAFAACFILYALFVSKSGTSYLIIAIFASFFHYSGLIIVFLYFIRAPLIGIASIILVSFTFDYIINALDKFKFFYLFLSDPNGKVNLTNSLFIAQLCIAMICIYKWKSLTVAQKKGAYLLMVGAVFYISSFNNATLAHRLRELSMLGIFPLLFLGGHKFSYGLIMIWLCVSYIIAYNLWAIINELLYLYFVS